MEELPVQPQAWLERLRARVNDDALFNRIKEEILFNTVYAASFHHGTDGHLARITIAHLAELLNDGENMLALV